jgi:hypothetical protein
MIPTEPIGNIRRPAALIEAVEQGDSDDLRLDSHCDDAIRDTIERFEATGTHDAAFAKIGVRVLGTALASEALGAL